jgi:hypothetical protein
MKLPDESGAFEIIVGRSSNDVQKLNLHFQR